MASGMRLARKLAPYTPRWIEDALSFDSLGPIGRLAEDCGVPLCASETVASVRFPRIALVSDESLTVSADG